MTQAEIKRKMNERIRAISDYTDDIADANKHIDSLAAELDDLNKELVSVTSSELRDYQRNIRTAYEQLKQGNDETAAYLISPYESIVLRWHYAELRQAVIIHYVIDSAQKDIYMPVAAFEFMLVVLGV